MISNYTETSVICIDAVTDVLKLGSGQPELTYGKEYEIVKWYGDGNKKNVRQFIGIINDSNVLTEYLTTRFTNKTDFRNIQLNKLI